MATSAHFIVNTLALKRGGLVKAVRDRASVLAATGALESVHIDVLGAQSRLGADVAELKGEGHLHPDVNVRSVLRVFDQSGAESRIPVAIGEEPGISSFLSDSSGRAFRLFRNGIYERYVRFDRNGIPEVVEYFTPSRYRFRREEMDESGRISRILEYQRGSNKPTVQRYIGRDGGCFLTIWHNAGQDAWAQSFLHGPEIELGSTGKLYTRAFELLLEPEQAPAICSEFRENLPNLPKENLDDVVRTIAHPNLLKVLTIHSNHLQPPYLRGSGTSPNWKRTLANLDAFDAVVALTPAQQADLADEAGHEELIRVIGQVAPPVAAPAPVNPLRIVLVARTHPKKRVDEAMRVMAHVLAEEPEAVLEVFGFGYGDAEEAKIEELIAELGIAESVRFMPFAQTTDEIYPGSCATLLTSASEGFPLILLESMSHGVPVLAYDSNYGPRDVITDGVNGFLVPFGEHQALADRVVELIRNPALRQSMEEGSRQTVTGFGPEAFTASWLNLLSTSPRPMRIRGATIGPVVDSARWTGPELELVSHAGVPERTTLLLNRRGSDPSTTEYSSSMTDGRWNFTLPAVTAGVILDAYVEVAGQRKRIQAGSFAPASGPGWGIYSTLGGWLSLKASKQ